MTRALTRRERLRRRPEFLRVQRRGVRTRGRYLTLFSLANGQDVTRLGVIATRRLGNAVTRNRSKRLVREIFRLNKGRVGIDLVVLPRPGFGGVAFPALVADYQRTLDRLERSHAGQ